MVLFVTALAGCGEDVDSSTPRAAVPDAPAAMCLVDAGATIATDTADIDFYKRAVREDEAENPGLAFGASGDVVVDTWQSVPGADNRWVLWAAQRTPFDGGESAGDLDVEEVLADGDVDTYVAFILNPSPAQQRDAAACLDALS